MAAMKATEVEAMAKQLDTVAQESQKVQALSNQLTSVAAAENSRNEEAQVYLTPI